MFLVSKKVFKDWNHLPSLDFRKRCKNKFNTKSGSMQQNRYVAFEKLRK